MNRKLWFLALASFVFTGIVFVVLTLSTPRPVSIPILVYHDVRDVQINENWQDLYVTPAVFEGHLAYLKAHGYTVISFAQLADYFAGKASLPIHPVILSFDDALKGQYANAFPLLKKYNVQAMFFIWTNMVGKLGFLSWQQIRQIQDQGMTIGGHTASHPHLLTLTLSLLQKEIIEDKKNLEHQLGKPIRVFAYPYGEFNDEIIGLVKQAGYQVARTTAQDNIQRLQDVFALHARVIGLNGEYFMQALGRN